MKKGDCAKIEKALHTAFAPQRINANREFFRIQVEQAKAILELFHHTDVTEEVSDEIENDLTDDDKAASVKAQIHRPPLNFYEIGMQNGDVLTWKDDPSVSVTIISERKVGKAIDNESDKLRFIIDGKTSIDANKLSSGEKQLLIILLTVLFEDGQEYVLLMDEPEISAVFFQQVGTQAAGALYGLFQFPVADFGLMATEQDVGYLPPFIVCRAGVDGGCQQVVLEAVGECRLLVADDAGDYAHHGVGNHGRHQFAARQHEVADTDFTCDEVVAYALVYTFVVASQDDEVALHRQLVGDMLVEAFAVGRGEDDLVIVTLSLQCRYAAVDGFALHHHARTSAVGVVVHAAPLVEGVVTQVVQAYFGQSLLLGPGQYTFVYEALQHFGQYGDDVYSHEI